MLKNNNIINTIFKKITVIQFNDTSGGVNHRFIYLKKNIENVYIRIYIFYIQFTGTIFSFQ